MMYVDGIDGWVYCCCLLLFVKDVAVYGGMKRCGLRVDWMCCFSSRRRHTRYWRDWSSDVCFFFSSRRRHTRYWRDWSSDVCSSDRSEEHTSELQSHPRR